MFPLVSCFAIVVFCLFVVYEWIYWIVGGDLSDHAPAPWVKKNASRHRTDILTESWVFAGVPQVSRETFWCLRESRKPLGKLFGVCGSPASLSENFLAFAGVPQASRKTFWCLRDSRKRLGKLFGVCGTPANVSVNAVELAQLAQTSWQMPWYLRSLRKRLGMERKIIPNGHLGHIIPRRLR